MSYQQVKYFQDLEDYVTAYKIACADWAANPSLIWPKNTIAWLLIRMMKYNARAYAQRQFLSQLEEFYNLDIQEGEKKLWGAVAWPVRDIITDSFQMQWFTPEFGDRLFNVIRIFPFDKPSDSYSALVKAFIQLGSMWPRLVEFIEWWGFDNFTDSDYRRYPENGRLESLAEKVLGAYLMALLREERRREPAKTFYDGLDHLALRSPEQADKIYDILTKLKKQ